MKLHAILENADGKQVSLSSNERIEATLYDGNKKAYSVYIDWCDIGDIIDDEGNDLPESKKTKGAIVTTQEWRNQSDARRRINTVNKLQGEKCKRCDGLFTNPHRCI